MTEPFFQSLGVVFSRLNAVLLIRSDHMCTIAESCSGITAVVRAEESHALGLGIVTEFVPHQEFEFICAGAQEQRG